MTDRVQPDSIAGHLVLSRLSGAGAPARGSSIDALFAQAMATVAAGLAPANHPTLGGVPAPAVPPVPPGRDDAKKRLTEAESRDAQPPEPDGDSPSDGVLNVNTPMSAAQHARQELRRASDSGASRGAESLAEPARSEIPDEFRESSATAPKPGLTKSDGQRPDVPSTATTLPRSDSTSPPGTTHATPPAGSGASHQHPGGQSANTSPGLPSSAAPSNTASSAVSTASGAGRTEGSSNAAATAASPKSDPIAALGALGARSSRVRFTTEPMPSQSPARTASLPDQVARGLATLLRHQGGSVTIRVTPESLGQIKINLKIEDAHVWASFQPSSDASRDAIQQSLATLRASLESRGLVVERLELVPTAPAQFDQSLRDSNSRPHTPTYPDSTGPDDPNTAGSQTGTDPNGHGERRHPSGRHESVLSRVADQGSRSDTELLPDSMGSASVLALDSPDGSGLARRLRLDAVA